MMADAFAILFGTDDLSVVPIEYFTDFRKFCGLQNDAPERFIERIDQAALNRFSLGVLESVIKLLDDYEDIDELGYEEDALRRSKILMQTFVNMANRSPRFRATCSRHTITHWMTLLRLEPIRLEVLASLFYLIRDMHKVFYSDETFIHLLSDLATLWNQVSSPSEYRNWISALFGILFEEDFCFLAECRLSMNRESFTDILFIAETFMEHLIPEREVMVHPGNVRFCVDYLEQIDLEVSMNIVNCDIGLRIYLCTDIITSASVFRPIYEDCLHNEQRAIKIICGFLKMLLEAEDFRRRETEAIRAANAASALRRINRKNRVASKFVLEDALKIMKESEMNKSKEPVNIVNLEKGGDVNMNNGSTNCIENNKSMDCNNSVDDQSPIKNSQTSESNGNLTEENEKSKDNLKQKVVEKMLIQNDNECSNRSENVVMMDESSRSNMSVDGEIICCPPSTKQYKLSNNENSNVEAVAIQKPEQNPEFVLRHKEVATEDNNSENSPKSPKIMASTSAAALILENLNECSTNTLKSNAQMRRLILTRQISPHIAMNMREALIRAIGNLCSDSPKNIQMAGMELNAVNMLVRCALKFDPEKALSAELAISALKNLCSESIENQHKLIEAVELTSSMFASIGLFSAIGFEQVRDEETGKILSLKKSSTKPFFNQVNLPHNGIISSSSSSSETSTPSKEEDFNEEERNTSESINALVSASLSTQPDGSSLGLEEELPTDEMPEKPEELVAGEQKEQKSGDRLRLTESEWGDSDSDTMDSPHSK